MITELAVERVEFTCGRCWHRWSTDYDVQHHRSDEDGRDWEYFSRDGIPVDSPYTPEGAPPCPQCGLRHWVGHLVARRLIPIPPGGAHTPRREMAGATGHRPERHEARPLGASDHAQPEPLQPQPGHSGAAEDEGEG